MAVEGLKKAVKPENKVVDLKASDIENPVLEAIDKVAEDKQPFLKEETNGDISVMGDPTQIEAPKDDTTYTVNFLFPKTKFKVDDFGNITFENEEFFTVATNGKQEAITPFNRTFLATVAVEFMLMFFEEHDGNMELKSEKDLRRASVQFYKNEELVEGTKDFVGKLLGVDEEYIPYINDMQLPTLATELITKNPTLINEAYFKIK